MADPLLPDLSVLFELDICLVYAQDLRTVYEVALLDAGAVDYGASGLHIADYSSNNALPAGGLFPDEPERPHCTGPDRFQHRSAPFGDPDVVNNINYNKVR